MVCHGTNKRIQGSGILDNRMRPFTYEKYKGERHAYSLAPSTFMKPMNFMGPGTRLDLRLNQDETPKENSQFVNNNDYESYLHDISYKHAKDAYLKNPTPENKKQQMKKVWEADDKFIRAMDRDTTEPMAPVAGRLIQAKEIAEKLGAPTTFSGFGTEQEPENADPVARLRQIVSAQYKTEAKNNNRKVQRGGFLPLIPIATAVASAIAGKLASELFDFVKSKVTGSGVKVPHYKTKRQRIEFLKEVVNNLN